MPILSPIYPQKSTLQDNIILNNTLHAKIRYMSISAIINTLNEEKNIENAIKSVNKFVDEIIVVDMHSDDNTRKLAKKLGAKVYKHAPLGYVEPARNYAISKATKDWILILDADEKVSKELSEHLVKITKDPDADYYRLPRKNIIFGKWIEHSRWWPDYNIRFFRKGHVSWTEIIHSVPETEGKGLDLKASEENAIIHNNYTSIEQYVDRLNRYTTHHAKLMLKDKYKFKWTDLIKKPSGEFLSRYFQAEGYKDGLHGLALASLQSFSELVLYLKVWQTQKFKQKSLTAKDAIEAFKETDSERNYWYAETLLKHGGSFKQRIIRKLSSHKTDTQVVKRAKRGDPK